MAKQQVSKKGITEMPHNIEAEQALLGCILLDTKIQIDIGATLKESDFYSEAHKSIFSAMLEIIKRMAGVAEVPVIARISFT